MSMKNPLAPAGIEPAALTTVLPRSPEVSGGERKLHKMEIKNLQCSHNTSREYNKED